MPRTIITTCGTSLFKSCCWKYEGLCNDSLSEMKDKQERMEYELVCNSRLKKALEEDYDLSKEFEPFSWENLAYMRDLPAELASLKVIQLYFKKIGSPLEKGDRVVLLHSDTDEGSFCSKILRDVLLNNNLLQGVSVDQWKVEGLNTQKSETFGYALRSIWKNMVDTDSEDGTEYFLNLTGGYKGLAILLSAFAYLHSNMNIFYLHEDTNYGEIFVFGFDKTKEKKERFNILDIYDLKKDQIRNTYNKTDSFGCVSEF